MKRRLNPGVQREIRAVSSLDIQSVTCVNYAAIGCLRSTMSIHFTEEE